MTSAAQVGISAKVAFLSRPSSYPDRTARVEIIETHRSWVFLTEGFVYKLKKPVRLDFLDFSTVDRRHDNCLAELRLNRRLAGDVYIEVVPLTSSSSGRLELGGEGEPVDWLVRMRRLPRQSMLDSVIARGQVDAEQIRKFARVLAGFYRRATPVRLTPGQYRGRYEQDIEANETALSDPEYALPRRQIATISKALLHYLARAQDVFDARVRARRIIEAHGDLRPEHICLTDPPVIIDCLEFNRRLRELDPADEMAFLDMECEFAGAPFIGPVLFETYRQVSGDDPPLQLVCFYKGYRAQMRAKLSIWHLDDCADRDRDKWLQRTEAYLLLAAQFTAALDRQQFDD
jgi:aminoglycoside phosphotransferase family enzyme